MMKKTQINIGINGFGRIGRALMRMNLEEKAMNISVINEIDPDTGNMAYLLKHDTTYGNLNKTEISHGDGFISVEGRQIPVYSEVSIADVPWKKYGVDIVVDSSGVSSNVLNSSLLFAKQGIRQVIVTHSPKEGIDRTLMIGVNETIFNPGTDRVISSSICDANAIAPFYKLIDDAFGVVSGEVTTLHPWLSYQNLLDGNVKSISNPGHYWTDYSLGRSSVGSMIPKDTTVVKALEQVLPGISQKLYAMSFRTPTSIVSIADGTLLLSKEASLEKIMDLLTQFRERFPHVLYLNHEPLVSIDYRGFSYAAIVDIKWLTVLNGKLLKFILYYDNEWGYASRTYNLIKFIIAG